ncbi:hypothetical protein [Alkanindiges illinoisensis]|uniref:Uncharacterized protein n=1 Tax=Alkanindiges illinoisensis TaxID=197183 RepID=A0A4Y7XDQ9_9GAMM|nr:hypothetical protein [Alkanindiges illinoisensis]TEU29300.1 hypothetical protein E2B99_04370 [Alkanindiges illinoisensis]
MNVNHLLVALVAALVFIVGGTWLYTSISNEQHRAKLAAAHAAMQDHSPVYSTVQVKMQGQGREITLKGVFESVDAEHCFNEQQKSSSLIGNYQQRCNSELSCQSVKLSSCSTFVEANYKDMLNKKPASTRYVHLQNAQNPKERGVLVFWGLSSSEADDFCTHMTKQRVPEQIEMACI